MRSSLPVVLCVGVACTFLGCTTAFVPASSKTSSVSLFAAFPDKSPLDDFKSRVDLSSIGDSVSSMKENAMSGNAGSRGEIWTASMVALSACVVAGNIPIIGGVANLVFGPVLFLAGLALTALGVTDLGESLSPWPQAGDKGLVTSGVYSKIRHPIYSGIVAAFAGASVISDSATRLLLTGILFFVMDMVSDNEEQQLQEKYPREWGAYLTQVPGKFLPNKDFFDELTGSFSSKQETNDDIFG